MTPKPKGILLCRFYYYYYYYYYYDFVHPRAHPHPQPPLTFVQVLSAGARAVTAGALYSLILKQDGTVWAAGDNRSGQLGDGTKTKRPSFVQVVSGGAQAVAAGNRHSMVLMQNGSVWATGSNQYGALGDGSETSTSIFIKITSAAQMHKGAYGSACSLGRYLFALLCRYHHHHKTYFLLLCRYHNHKTYF